VFDRFNTCDLLMPNWVCHLDKQKTFFFATSLRPAVQSSELPTRAQTDGKLNIGATCISELRNTWRLNSLRFTPSWLC